MIILFFRWLIRLPLLLVIGTLLAGMLIGTYKILTHFWGGDIFEEILRRRSKGEALEKKIQDNKNWEQRLSYEEAYVKRKEEEMEELHEILSEKI